MIHTSLGKRFLILLLLITGAAFVLMGCGGEQGPIELPHIHGLGYSPDGRQLIVPAHDGLRVFADGRWSIPDVPGHDYMGYAAMDEGFYSSGHPNPSSNLVNPFGLVKSTDDGRTLQKLGFEGETDFHLMGVGYNNHTLYVLNPAANSTLPAGLHYSLDDGQTWQPCAAQGITGQPFQIAVHPTEANIIAIATEAGLFLSDDYGNSFSRVGEEALTTAVAFHPDGQTLLIGADRSRLRAYDLSAEQLTEISSPALTADDPIAYVAVNPVQPDEIALATFDRDIYYSPDRGETWSQIAEDGIAQ